MVVALSLQVEPQLVERELDKQGFSIVPGVLAREDAGRLKARLWEIAAELQQKGVSTHTSIIDHSAANVRIYDLPDHDPVFLDLLSRSEILEIVRQALAGDFLASNFSANIACPGARPMNIHSDMALVIPEPWRQRWALNVIWCLDDIWEANGATRYLPGSHRLATLDALPPDAATLAVPFEARAGSIIIMDGRLWHTSGANVTEDEDRALLFAYYSRSFVRPQVNWYEAMRPDVIQRLTEQQRQLFGFGPLANIHGSRLVLLDPG